MENVLCCIHIYTITRIYRISQTSLQYVRLFGHYAQKAQKISCLLPVAQREAINQKGARSQTKWLYGASVFKLYVFLKKIECWIMICHTAILQVSSKAVIVSMLIDVKLSVSGGKSIALPTA